MNYQFLIHQISVSVTCQLSSQRSLSDHTVKVCSCIMQIIKVWVQSLNLVNVNKNKQKLTSNEKLRFSVKYPISGRFTMSEIIVFAVFVCFTNLFPPPFLYHQPKCVSSMLSWSTLLTYDLLISAAVNIQEFVVPPTQKSSWCSWHCTAVGSLHWLFWALLLLSFLAALVTSSCASHQVSQSCVLNQSRSGRKRPTTFRTSVGEAFALFLIPVILNTLHAKVVPTRNRRRIPEDSVADSTAEVIHSHRDVELCHFCKEKCNVSSFVFFPTQVPQ